MGMAAPESSTADPPTSVLDITFLPAPVSWATGEAGSTGFGSRKQADRGRELHEEPGDETPQCSHS